jgi:hypothetical protein
VSRDKIKIIEFGMEDDGPSPADSAGGAAMRIIEFDNDPQESQTRVATAKDVGHIKIVEFDDDSKTKKAPMPEKPRKPVGPVKIKEFDKEEEAETRGPGFGAPKIKIMEFD